MEQPPNWQPGPQGYGNAQPNQAPFGQDPYGQGQNPYGQNPYGQNPYGQNPYGQNPYGQNPPGQNPYGQNPPGQNPYGQNAYGQPPFGQSQDPYGRYPNTDQFVTEKASSLEAMKFAAADPNFGSNLLFGSLFVIIPIVGVIALMGWVVEIRQRVARKHPNPIPKISFADFGHYLGRGLFPFLVTMCFAVVGVVLSQAAQLLANVLEAVVRTSGNSDIVLISGVITGLVVLLLMLVIQVAIKLFSTVVMIRMELTESFGEAFSFDAGMDFLKRTWLTIIWTSITMGFLAFGVMALGLLALCVGYIPAIVMINCAQGHLRSQLYGCYLVRGGQPIAIKQPQMLPSEVQLQQGYY